jgi:hypothetical protein
MPHPFADTSPGIMHSASDVAAFVVPYLNNIVESTHQ